MPFRIIIVIGGLIGITSLPLNAGDNWHQPAGPNGNWQVEGNPPVTWSVTRNENIRWRTPLPEAGMSGVTIWDDLGRSCLCDDSCADHV